MPNCKYVIAPSIESSTTDFALVKIVRNGFPWSEGRGAYKVCCPVKVIISEGLQSLWDGEQYTLLLYLFDCFQGIVTFSLLCLLNFCINLRIGHASLIVADFERLLYILQWDMKVERERERESDVSTTTCVQA